MRPGCIDTHWHSMKHRSALISAWPLCEPLGHSTFSPTTQLHFKLIYSVCKLITSSSIELELNHVVPACYALSQH